MNSLVSKVQYKRSEKGEFHHIAHRDLEETTALILNYPWDTERSLASVELTCPSVTIEHPTGTFLKIGPYFSGKYSLYYLSTNRKVFLRVVATLEDACKCVKSFFNQNGKLFDFDKYEFTINPASYFHTNPFEYTTDAKAAWRFFSFPLVLMALLLFLPGLGFYRHSEVDKILEVTGVIMFMSLIFWSPVVYFYFNYLSADKEYYLKISRGHDVFVYGTKGNKKTYQKTNLVRIDNFLTRSTRSPWRHCQVFVLSFKDGEQICFTSLLISENTLRSKLPGVAITENSKFFPTVGSVANFKYAP